MKERVIKMTTFLVIIFNECETETKVFFAYSAAETYYERVKMTKNYEILTLMNSYGHIYEQVTNL